MKLNISKQTTEVTEVEITLPYFAKSGNCYWAITGKFGNLKIEFNSETKAAIHNFACAEYIDQEHTQISREEFIDEYQKAQQKINETFLNSCRFVATDEATPEPEQEAYAPERNPITPPIKSNSIL